MFGYYKSAGWVDQSADVNQPTASQPSSCCCIHLKVLTSNQILVPMNHSWR
jgi:hypothetical protein